MPVSMWESAVLPARVRDFRPDDLDAACADGSWTWWGRAQGLVAAVGRGNVPAGFAVSGLAGAGDAVAARRIADVLDGGGGWFLGDVLDRLERDDAVLEADEAVDAVFRLLWAGAVSSDVFAPLRRWLDIRREAHFTLPVRHRRHGAAGGLPGRWQASRPHVVDDADVAHVADELLDRYGVVCKQMLRAERRDLPWPLVYAELRRRAMCGEVGQGLFVEGLDGAQFARSAAVDQLRDTVSAAGPVLLGGCDPANVWGRIIPVAAAKDIGWKARTAGTFVVTESGRVLALISRWGRDVTVLDSADHGAAAAGVAAALARLAEWRRRRVRVERWNGAPAGGCAPSVRAALADAGFALRGGGFVRRPGGAPGDAGRVRSAGLVSASAV